MTTTATQDNGLCECPAFHRPHPHHAPARTSVHYGRSDGRLDEDTEQGYLDEQADS